jgi:hypothetical protein
LTTKRKSGAPGTTAANVGYEAQLWQMADALLAEQAQGADPEDPDEYHAQTVFRVPPEARWPQLKAQARQSTIGQLVDDAMAAIERDNKVSAQADVSEAKVEPRSGGCGHTPVLRSAPPAGQRSPNTEPRTGSFSA